MLSSSRFVIIMISLILTSYSVDSGLDSLFFYDSNFWEEFLHPEPLEIYMRSLGAVFILITGMIWRLSERRRHAADAAIQVSRKLYRDVVESCPDVIFIHRDNQTLYVNPVGRRFLGLAATTPLDSMVIDEFVHPDDRPASRKRRAEILGGSDQTGSAPVRIILNDGVIRHTIVTSKRIVFEGELALLTFCRDITDELATRQDFEASQERLSLALDAAQDGVWDWDMVNNERHYNHAWATMLGLDDAEGTHTLETWDELVHPGDKQRALDALAAHASGETTVFESEVRLRHADGHDIWVLDRGKIVERASDGTPLRMTGTHRNITVRKEAQIASESKESQLRQAQKMEAIGALAGGIAHDFNNILQAILGFSTLAREEALAMDSPQGRIIEDDLERVERATQRGRDLVNRILLFSRRQEHERQPMPVGPVITDSINLLNNTIPATIEVRMDLSPSCPHILADSAQISQVLLNLATNSFHAMEQDGGILTIGLRSVTCDDEDPLVPDEFAGQNLVTISVSDTGAGMDEETLARLYDPFFTTREVGKGTGLGLSVVHGIVTSHGGEIVIQSQVGQGTTVHIFLPALADSAGISPPDLSNPPVAEQAMRVGRILFIDDEVDIVVLGKALLEKQGYDVLTLTDSQAAFERFSQSPGDFDLLITDQTMPQLTGVQLSDKVARIRPDLPVILITGIDDLFLADFSDHQQIKGVIRKPFGGNELRNVVREVLGEASPHQSAPEA